MSFKRYGKIKPTDQNLQREVYYLLQVLKDINKNSESKVIFELDDPRVDGKWEITFKRM